MAAPRVFVLYTEGGGGHRSVATALSERLRSAFGWEVVVVNAYRDVDTYVDLFRILTGRPVDDLYNEMLKHFIPTYVPWQFFHAFANLVRLNKLIYGRRASRKLERYWRREQPDLVVSVMPWVNDMVANSVRRARPGVPFVTVMTDYDECSRGMWFSPSLHYVICSSSKAARRAALRGIPREGILTVPGVVVSSAFCEAADEDRDETRARLGLEPGVPAGLVMYGRQGASRMIEVARAMTRAEYPFQLMFVCGHDDSTAAAIRALPTPYPKAVFGYVDEVHRYMRAADFFVSKPGPSSIAEALAIGLPMVLDFDWRTMLQDRYNAMWAAESGVALLSRGLGRLPKTVGALLDGYDGYRAAAQAASGGQALPEVTALLERWVAGAGVGAT
jgi:UDP-N-acetylglucosamine:LPS N-acetylglucosamine transferase